jgi:23S rRNA pseudouridine2605 synthase
MRLNGHGVLTLEDARTWIEETGLCLFLPRRQFSVGVAPSFVEAIAGERNPNPGAKQIALAEELLVRLETDGVAVRLNLLGQPGEQPDFVVAAWVLPYVYALRGDRDWRRIPQLTGSRQVSPLAVQAYKLLEAGDATIPQLKHALGREVTETAVLRAITELWQQLRIIPVVSAPGKPAQWQLLRTRFQKAIAEGASTSQVTAISVLASIYLQAVIAASMEEVELFLAPLTARSKIREVLRGLVATRQVHTISFGHAPHFYVAGTLPEFAVAPTVYASSAMAASSYFSHARSFEDEFREPVHRTPPAPPAPPAPVVRPSASLAAPLAAHLAAPPAAPPIASSPTVSRIAAEGHSPRASAPRIPALRKPAASAKPAARPHFSRPAAHARDRKPAQSNGRPARRPSRDSRTASARPANGLRHGSAPRWSASTSGQAKSNGAHTNSAHSSGNGARSNGNGHSRPNLSNGLRNGVSGSRNGKPTASVHAGRNGHSQNGHSGNGRNGKSTAPVHSGRNGSSRNGHGGNGHNGSGHNGNGHNRNAKSATQPRAKSGVAVRKAGSRNEVRLDARSKRKPALTANAKANNGKRYGFTAPSRQRTKKRG